MYYMSTQRLNLCNYYLVCDNRKLVLNDIILCSEMESQTPIMKYIPTCYLVALSPIFRTLEEGCCVSGCAVCSPAVCHRTSQFQNDGEQTVTDQLQRETTDAVRLRQHDHRIPTATDYLQQPQNREIPTADQLQQPK